MRGGALWLAVGSAGLILNHVVALQVEVPLAPNTAFLSRKANSTETEGCGPPNGPVEDDLVGKRCFHARELISDETPDAPWPAWIHIARPEAEAWLHLPGYGSVAEALKKSGLQVRIRFNEDNCNVPSELRQAIARGVTKPIVISFSHHTKSHPSSACSYESAMKEISRLGAYLIVYNTEPDNWVPSQLVNTAASWRAREIWDYSQTNLAAYSHLDPWIVKRYVPPGCAAILDAGVDMAAPQRDINALFILATKKRRSPSLVGTLGQAFGLSLRWPEKLICEKSDFKQYFEQSPLQLNIHSQFNARGAFEAFRAALILANKGCLLSQSSPSHRDQQIWEGAVHFMGGSAQAMHKTFLNFRGNDAAIQQCRQQSQQLCQQHLQPLQLLQASGFTAVLEGLKPAALR